MDDTDWALLEMAGRRYRHAGARDEAIRVELGLTATVFASRVNRLIDDPAALLAEPVLVNRLLRLRDARRRERSPRRVA